MSIDPLRDVLPLHDAGHPARREPLCDGGDPPLEAAPPVVAPEARQALRRRAPAPRSSSPAPISA